MTTKAIEAGARADLLPCPFCNSSDVVCCDQGDDDFAVTCKSCGSSSPFNDVEASAIAAWNRRPAAIASGELVPASAVAAERERCAAVCAPYINSEGVREFITAKSIRDAIRALEPTSGEYVLVPREPTKEMVAIADDLARRYFKAPPVDLYKAMLTAATSNGSGSK